VHRPDKPDKQGGVAVVGNSVRTGVVILPDLRWAGARTRWQEAERRGFTTAWTYDHLSWRSLRDRPWLGAVPLLAAVAASTTTLRVGTLVTSPNFRHPALLAKDVMTLDEVSGGRIDLGVGAGGTGFDAVVLGEAAPSPKERAARFVEFVDALDLLLREPAASYDGRFFRAVESRTYPGCTQRPRVPFTVAAAGRRALRVAARHGQTWVTYGPVRTEDPSPEEFYRAVASQAATLEEECSAAGRDPRSIRRAVLVSLDVRWAQGSVDGWDDFCGHVETLGFGDVIVHWPRPDDDGLPGPAPAVFDEISRRLTAS
jgi:alkanesulfonate monooxygenase SsuD/methylene tetrahydromethanopterin reductase-like flavin-dependent oxidoreductase (luciferase family)